MTSLDLAQLGAKLAQVGAKGTAAPTLGKGFLTENLTHKPQGQSWRKSRSRRNSAQVGATVRRTP